MKIQNVLRTKNHQNIYSVRSDQTVLDALALMAEKNIGAVLVIDDSEIKGIFSERDYARKGILQGRSAKTTFISDVMTTKLITISLNQSIEEAMQIMSDKHIRHLPVMDDKKLVGLISINDVVTSIIQNQQEMIASLESYISGNPIMS